MVMVDEKDLPPPRSLGEQLSAAVPDPRALLVQMDRDPSAVIPPPAKVRALVGELGLFGTQQASNPELEKERDELLDFARRAIEALRKGLKPDVPLTREEEIGAAALLTFQKRPALLVQDDKFMEAQPPWQDELGRLRKRIERTLPRVGRVAIEGLDGVPWAGTGWLAAPGLIMTNRHVVKRFAEPASGNRWKIQSGLAARIDFSEEEKDAPGWDASRTFDVPADAQIVVHPEADLALVPVAGANRGPQPQLLPTPLVLASGGSAVTEGRKVYAVGYPAQDPFNPDPLSEYKLFQGIFNVKRLQPGQVLQVLPDQDTVLHDCSTLGGNSGSCLVDLATNQVVGLHYAGYHRRTNLAVALWSLVGDPLLREAGVRFYGEE
jgi:S1-C subfamily serine protease